MLAELASAGVQLAGGLIGGKMQSDAIKHAQKIQAGQQVAANLQRQATLNEVQQMQAPGLAAYYTGLNALTGRLGLPTAGVGQAITQQTTPRQGFNATQFLADHPEVRAAFEAANPNHLRNNIGIEATPEAYAEWFYKNHGQFDPGYAMPATGASPITGQTAGQTIDMAQQADGSYAMPATDPKATGGNALTGATGVQPGTYGNATNPTYTAPEAYSFTQDDYEASPAFQFQLDQALGGTLATASKTGALRSGAAAKALQDRAQQIAYQDFANERNFDYGRFIDQRNFDRSNYENDRNYLTQRYDRNTDDVFRYTGMGQNALNTVTGAVTGYGDALARGHLDQGEIAAQGALARGDIWSGLVSNIAGLGSSFLSGLGGGGSVSPMNALTSGQSISRSTPISGNQTFKPLPTLY